MPRNLNDDNITKLSRNSTTSFDLNICVCGHSTNIPLGYEWGPFIRDYYVIQCCVAGRGTLYINDIPFSIETGQCFAVFPGNVILEIADEVDPWELLYVGIKGTKAPFYLRRLGISELSPLFKWGFNEHITHHIREILRLSKTKSETCELQQIGLLCSLLCEFNQLNAELPIIPTAKTNDIYINEAIQFMEFNYFNKITVSDVAMQLGFNRSYFSRLFKKYTCMSPQDYLTQLRIKKACEFLAVPNSTVASVANSVGYEPFAFSRIFHQIMGISPSEYKKHLLECT